MSEGKTLILLRSRYIYESLLDAPNEHYIHEVSNEAGGEVLYRSMLSLAGETKSVFINPLFRCIVLEYTVQLARGIVGTIIGGSKC
jgi:hypothetical protein